MSPPEHSITGQPSRYAGDRLRRQRRGHDHHLQIRPHGLLDLPDHAQGQIAVQVPLVEFVEDDDPHFLQEWIVVQPAEQDALGDDRDPSPVADPILEPHLVADLAAQRPPVFRGHPRRRRPGRDAPRLEHEDPLAARNSVPHQGRRYPRRLAGPRGARKTTDSTAAQACDQVRQNLVDRQPFHVISNP